MVGALAGLLLPRRLGGGGGKGFCIPLVLLLLQITLTAAFHFKNDADFNRCWVDVVQHFNTSDFNDTRQHFAWDRTHRSRVASAQPLITLDYCQSTCGAGYQLWPADDTMLRITMWVFPAVVLLAHFHFPPLGGLNSLRVALHLVGDPLDTLWSMMTRQEVNRRLHRRAKRFADVAGPHHIATVWSAYDELGWRDPSAHFDVTLALRHNPRSPDLPKTHVDHQAPPGPTRAELYYIQLASHRLAANRSESQLTTWIAVVGLGGALMAAFIRTYSEKIDNQTAHTIAVVALLFVLIPTVTISGHLGSFTSASVPVDIIQDLRRSLRALDPSAPELFPPLVLHPDDTPWDYARASPPAVAAAASAVPDREMEAAPPNDEYRNLEAWPRMAPWAGMNCSWRPCKTMLIQDNSLKHNRSSRQLFLLSLVFVMCAYAPALVLSYQTPTIGFSCRSMAWTLILMTWLLSAAVDQGLKLRISSARSLWTVTLFKDAVVTAYFMLTIATAQLGFLNSCWCLSGVLELGSQAYVNVGPQRQQDWDHGWPLWTITPVSFALVILALILTVGADGAEARTLLARTEDDRQRELLDLMRMRDELGAQGDVQLAHLQDLPGRGRSPVHGQPDTS